MKMEPWRRWRNNGKQNQYVILVVIAILALVMAMLVSYVRTDHEKMIMDDLTLCTVVDGQEFSFKLWQDEEEEEYYLFLPSCFLNREIDLEVHYADNQARLAIDEQRYVDGDIWEQISGESVHNLKLTGIFGAACMEKTVQVLISENLPVMMVTVQDRESLQSSEDFSNKKYLENGELTLLDPDGNLVCSQHMQTFKVRGNLTATLDKKPYTFSLREPVAMLGMNPGMKWNLLANATDGSYIRNKLVLDLANAASDTYEPDGEFVELYLNGMYQGLYLLTEAANIEEKRVNISPSDDWFLEMELDFRMEDGTPYVITNEGQIIEIETENWVSEDDKQEVVTRLNDIESALDSEDGISQISGKHLSELIDFESWAQVWLIEEISGDHDTGIASQFAYMSKDADSLLYAGPVWDFDGTMGNVHTAMFANPVALTTSIANSRPEGDANQNRWLAAMYQNPDFRKALEETYETAFLEPFKDILDKQIGVYMAQIHRAAVLDTLRWHENCFEWMFVLPDDLNVPEDGDYTRFDVLDCQVGMVSDFLAAKYDFLNRLFVEHKDFCIVTAENNAPFYNQDYNHTTYYWVERGTAITNLPIYKAEGYQFKGYVDKASGQEVSDGTIIYEDSVLECVWEESGE